MEKKLKVVDSGLVPVYETSTGEKVVFGTELHKVLGVGRDFTTWIKGRLQECDAVESDDFDHFPQNGGKPSGGRPKHEYILKLDIAKEMAMLEHNDKGKQVRRYFIQVEKKCKILQKVEQEQFEKFGAFIKRQEEFNQAVMKKLEYMENGGNRKIQENLFILSRSVMDERMRILNDLVDQVSDLCGIERNKVLHYMYKTLQERLGISLNPYLSVMKSESGDIGICNIHVIASVDRFYEAAVEMNRFVIERKMLFG